MPPLNKPGKSVAVVNVRLPTRYGKSRATLITDGARVAEFGDMNEVKPPTHAEVVDGRGLTLLPGFIDVHVHGGGGADMMEATPDALRTMCRTHARHGTTSLLATTITQSREKITAALKNARAAVEAGPDFCPDGAQVMGVHLEGPYISPARPGAQPKEFVRAYDPAEFQEWLDVAGGTIKLITLAPECPGADELIRVCRDNNIVVSIGHTDATAEETQRAIDLGATHATHLFNAMPPIHHRNPGPIPVLINSPKVRIAEIIADGHHIAPEVAVMVFQHRGSGGAILITDAMAGAGAPDGIYDLGGHAVNVANGKATLPNGTLAGSVLTMAQAARNIRDWQGKSERSWDKGDWDFTWYQISLVASFHAAKEMGWTEKCWYGGPEHFDAADFVLLDDDFTVHATYVAGNCVYRR